MPARLKTLYEKHCLPHLIDLACGASVFQRQREKVVPQAVGQVLEIGMGTGLNLPFYQADKIVQLTGIDPGLAHSKLNKRLANTTIPVELVDLTAETLPFDDNTFDTVVVTYSLCTIPDAVAALREMHRVLKPTGQLLYCEHGLSPDAKVAKWQRRLNPWWQPIAGGCHLDRDIPALLRTGGFHPQGTAGYVPGPKLFNYNYWGKATPSV